ncbi:MAG: dienelactone hydrolase family protein [Erysipelotrichaceae bacterium]|nr:dienelactone hydrolase family protein [Erysipelotrichaceae bacterium]MBR6232897.1 dienelactone hydrolase family protein [Erysipelotrichaceae bacterium]
MWNDFNTGDHNGMIAETIDIKGKDDQPLRVYYSHPLKKKDVPSLVLIPHMPGWDEYCREASRRFTEHGYAVVCPDIYQDFGTGKPTEVSKKMMEAGGVKDESVMDDVRASIDYLKDQEDSNGKVGVIGMCSGGRHAFMAACQIDEIDAAADLWGGGVIMKEEDLNEARPVSPIDLVDGLKCPLIGIFGNDDRRPDVNEVNETERILKEKGKDYEFHRYDGAGHGIWYYDKPMYRQEAAMDSFNKVLEFFDKNLK